ncbi:MAG: ATP-grasp domain-containing protein [Planctomycetota bacterium]
MPKRLAIVGASARAAACSAVDAGFEVIAADLFADADLAARCHATRIADYPAALEGWLADADCDGWLYTGALENRPDLVGRMAEVKPLLGNGPQALAGCRDPQRLASLATESGVGFPDTATLEDRALEAGWLVKAAASAGGGRVWSTENWEQLKPADRPSDALLQRRVTGQSGAAVFLASRGVARLVGVSRQLTGEAWTGSSGFAYCGSIAPWAVPLSAAQGLQQFANTATASFGLAGLFGVDFVLDGGQPWVLEINPRYTASVEVLERCLGTSTIPGHVDSCRGRTPENLPRPQKAAGKAILYAQRPFTLSQRLAEELLESPGHGGYADIPHGGTVFDAGDPVLTVFAEAARPDEVEPLLRDRAGAMEARLYD